MPIFLLQPEVVGARSFAVLEIQDERVEHIEL
jgi:hypothetical protein